MTGVTQERDLSRNRRTDRREAFMEQMSVDKTAAAIHETEDSKAVIDSTDN